MSFRHELISCVSVFEVRSRIFIYAHPGFQYQGTPVRTQQSLCGLEVHGQVVKSGVMVN